MDGATLQAIIYNGYGIAAGVLGATFQQYRPLSVGQVVTAANFIGTVSAAFDAKPNYQFQSTTLYGKPFWYALLNGSLTKMGDHLHAEGAGTYFIAQQQPLEPILAVHCNATVNFLRPTPNSGVGSQPYGGDLRSNETPILTGWPAALLQGTKGEKGDTVLPGDVRMPWFEVYVSSFSGVQIEAADVMTDDLGRRFKVSGAELTTKGWRLTAMLSET